MSETKSLTVAVLGASDRPDRYSCKAVQMLIDYGHKVYPVSTREISLPGLTVCSSVAEVPKPVHTITLYVNPKVLETLADDIIALGPERIIFNPGTEHPDLERRFREVGIRVVEACTLVLLRSGQFASA